MVFLFLKDGIIKDDCWRFIEHCWFVVGAPYKCKGENNKEAI